MTRLLPTLLIAAVCAAVEAVRRRRDAQRAEHATRPRDSHTATAARDAAAILANAIQEQQRA